jgi:hypothetical protein
MNHLKPYTQFKIFENSDVYLEDAKWIIISHLGEVQEVKTNENIFFYGELMSFKIDNDIDNENIKSCESHLNSDGFFMIRDKEYIWNLRGQRSRIENTFTVGIGDVNKVIQKIDIYKYRRFENSEKIDGKLDNIDTNHINSALDKYKSIIKYCSVKYRRKNERGSTSIYGTPNTCYVTVNEEEFKQKKKPIYLYSFEMISYNGWYYLVSESQRSRSVQTAMDVYRFKLESFENVINLLLGDIEKK